MPLPCPRYTSRNRPCRNPARGVWCGRCANNDPPPYDLTDPVRAALAELEQRFGTHAPTSTFGFRSAPIFDPSADILNLDFDAINDASTLEMLVPADGFTTQPSCNLHRCHAILDGDVTGKEMPFAIDYGTSIWFQDGHHRLSINSLDTTRVVTPVQVVSVQALVASGAIRRRSGLHRHIVHLQTEGPAGPIRQRTIPSI